MLSSYIYDPAYFEMPEGAYLGTQYVRVPANDLGVTRAFTIFTVLRARGGVAFQLDAHIKRIITSAKIVHMRLPHNTDQLTAIVQQVVGKNFTDSPHENMDLTVKIMYTGGPEGKNHISQAGLAVLYILVNPYTPPPETVKLVTCTYQRPHSDVKLNNYVDAIIEYAIAVESYGQGNVDDVLYTENSPAANVLECSTSNIFGVWEKNGEFHIVTPPAEKTLQGITRDVLLNVLSKNLPANFIFAEKDIPLANLIEGTTEVLLTSSTGPRNVRSINDEQIGDGKVGPVTTAIIQALDDFQKQQCGLI